MSGAFPRSHTAVAVGVATAMILAAVSSLPSAFVPLGPSRASSTQPEGFTVAGLASGAGAPLPGAGSSACLAPCIALLSLGAAVAVGKGATRRRQGERAPRCVQVAAEEGEGGDWKGAEGYSALTESVPLHMDNVAISKILPHRYPFLLVDKVVAFEPGKRAVGVKNVTANEPQFTGHFPDRPIMPGVLMVEALAQLGGIICLQAPVSDGQGQFFFAGIDGVKFRKPVVPGDTLVMEAELVKFREKFGIAKLSGKAYVDGKVAVEVKSMTFAIVKES